MTHPVATITFQLVLKYNGNFDRYKSFNLPNFVRLLPQFFAGTDERTELWLFRFVVFFMFE